MTSISIITACYNNVATITDVLDCLRDQSHRDYEHVVVDGASSDGTLQLLQAHREDIAVLVSERDAGIYDALNKGLRRCSGDVVGFLHADDVLDNTQVLSQISTCFEDPSVDVVYGDLVYVPAHDISKVVRYWRSGSFHPRMLSRGWMPPHPTLYVRRSVYELVGSFDTNYRIAGDYESILRIFRLPNLRCHYLPQVLVRMRTGGMSNKSVANLWRKTSEDYRALRQHGIGGLGSVLYKNLRKVQQLRTLRHVFG
jgi:glycosyltransferase involved in cell wall biosynthesis